MENINKKLKILKMRDSSDSNVTKKKDIFDLPMRLLIIAKSGQGKSSYLGNLLLRPEFYRNDFEPENIFIFTGSKHGDKKLATIITELDIEEENVIDGYDEDLLETVYDMLVENYNEKVEDGIKSKKKLNSLIIFDDLAFSGTFKDKGNNDQIRRIFFNARKHNISVIVISQKYSAVSTSIRENSTGLVLGSSSNKQAELIESDHNMRKDGKKAFLNMYREATDVPFSMLVINYSNYPHIYQTQDFEAIKLD